MLLQGVVAFQEVLHAHPWDKNFGTSGGSTKFFIIELSIRNLNYIKFNKKDKLNILTLHKKKKFYTFLPSTKWKGKKRQMKDKVRSKIVEMKEMKWEKV